jgi:ABC-type uncharacterized transport system substrate-binding protein
VLQSYRTDYSWTRDVDTGLRRVLESRLRYKVVWHYMDTKNHPDAEFKQRAAALALRAIENFKPHLIIAVDDDAQEYVAKHFVNRRGVAVVYAGINGPIEPYGYHRAANAAGILERRSMLDLRDAILAMRRREAPLGSRVLHLGDHSESVRLDTLEIEDFDWQPLKLVRSARVATFGEWQGEIARAAGAADVILVSNYRNLRRKEGEPALVPPEEVVRWSEQHSPLPLIGLGGFFVEEGGMFAIGASGFEQGEVTARMAVRILEGEALPPDLGVHHPQQFIVYMRPAALEKRGVTLPRLYEAFARGTHNYFE